MCGIAGYRGKNNQRKAGKIMQSMEHRGRDESIFYSVDRMNFMMARLSINDLRAGLYPLRYRHFSLIFNGEIYNYAKLKKRLEKSGIKLETRCDGEVILPLFAQKGIKALDELEGMFAVSIFDEKNGQLWLGRDKLGEKPLYYKYGKGKFCFASEIKSILKLYEGKGEAGLNKEMLSRYLSQGFIEREETLVEGINKVLPGTFIKYDLKSEQLLKGSYTGEVQQYKKRSDFSGLSGELDKLLEEAVKERLLLSDVAVGCFLSGGVDSSLITYYAARHKEKINSYSIAFPSSLRHDESLFAREAAKMIGTKHHEVVCDSKNVAEVFEKIEELVDEPVVDPAVLPTYLLAKEARKGVKVVLTGEGADEVFGGYYRYQKELLASRIRRLVNISPILAEPLRRTLRGKFRKIMTDIWEHYRAQDIWKQEEMEKLLPELKVTVPQSQFRKDFEKDELRAMQLTDIRGYLAEQLLMKVDKMTMANNLESRAPFLDPKVVAFGLALERSKKIRGIQGKYILKTVASKYFPKSFVWRPKHGFSVPLSSWFKKELKEYVVESLKSVEERRDLFNYDYYKVLVDEHLSGSENHSDKIWSLILLTRWLDRYQIK